MPRYSSTKTKKKGSRRVRSSIRRSTRRSLTAGQDQNRPSTPGRTGRYSYGGLRPTTPRVDNNPRPGGRGGLGAMAGGGVGPPPPRAWPHGRPAVTTGGRASRPFRYPPYPGPTDTPPPGPYRYPSWDDAGGPRLLKGKKKKKAGTLRPSTRNSLMSKTRRPQNRPLMNPGFVTDLYRPATPRLGY